MNSILFVCLGNICRSPLAEGIAQKIAQEKNLELRIESAGTSSWHEGETPCSDSITIASHHNVDISSQRSMPVTQAMLNEFDLIIGLDDKNVEDLENMGAKNVYKLGQFGLEGRDVPDPYFFRGDHVLDGFEEVFQMIEKCVKELLSSELVKS